MAPLCELVKLFCRRFAQYVKQVDTNSIVLHFTLLY